MGKRKVTSEEPIVANFVFPKGLMKEEATEETVLLNDYKEWLESRGYNVLGVYLKGSQNYNLDDRGSDVDAVAICLPSLSELIARKDLTRKFKFNTGEVLVNDLHKFATQVNKGHCGFIEMVHTNFFVGMELTMFKHYPVNPKTMNHMAQEKKVALCKPYPSKAKEIETWGFDPKQLHHIIRLCRTLEKSLGGSLKHSYYVTRDREYEELMELKRYGRWDGKVLTVEEAKGLANYYCARIQEMTDARIPDYEQLGLPMEEIEKVMITYYKTSLTE